MKKFIICVDFDGVLFDSVSRVFSFPEIAKIEPQRFMDAFRTFRKKQEFLPESFCQFLAERGLITQEEAASLCERFLGIQRDAANLLYPDAIEFLKQFPKENLMILSRAHPDWQKPNISSVGLDKFTARVDIVQGEKGKKKVLKELSQQYPLIYFIDDDPKELETVKKLPGVKFLLLNRGKMPDAKGGYKNLLEAAEAVKKDLTQWV